MLQLERARKFIVESQNKKDVFEYLKKRIEINKKTAQVSTTSEDEKSLKNLVIKAIEIAKNSLENPYDVIAQKNQFSENFKNENLEIYDHKTDDFSNTSIFEELAITADKASCQNDKISNTDGSSAGCSTSEFILCTSNGFKNGYKRSSFYISSSSIAEHNNKMEREYAFEQRVFLKDLPNPSEIGKLAADRAINMIGAVKPSTGNYPVIFNERISSSTERPALYAGESSKTLITRAVAITKGYSPKHGKR